MFVWVRITEPFPSCTTFTEAPVHFFRFAVAAGTVIAAVIAAVHSVTVTTSKLYVCCQIVHRVQPDHDWR